MNPIELPAADPHAASLIGVVLIEAMALYAGYGAIERLVGPRLLQTLLDTNASNRN